jgi:toxin FitB
VTRYLLDTNIISNATKSAPSQSLIDWLAKQPDESLFISSLTIAEIRRGVLEAPRGKRRDRLEVWFAGADGPQALFHGRVLPFDERAALVWARLMSEGRAVERPRSDMDMIVAATAEANDCIVVTDNEKHFPGIEVFNPIRS